jgi:hypothetical protein
MLALAHGQLCISTLSLSAGAPMPMGLARSLLAAGVCYGVEAGSMIDRRAGLH